MKRRISTTLAVFALGLLLTPGPARAQITPTKVLGGALNQEMPSANAVYLTWTSNVSRHPRHYNVYSSLLASPDSPTKVNPIGTSAFSLSIEGDTTGAIYQEVTRGRHFSHSNVYQYDLVTQTRTAPPSGVNTTDWEWRPTISSGYILFGRNRFNRPSSPWKVIPYDRTNMTFTMLAKEPYRCRCIFPGAVTDSYATWTDCGGKVCQAYYYDIANSTAHKVSNPQQLQQYYASVDGSGTELYYIRSGNGCGVRVKIMRLTIGSGSVVVSALPPGYDDANNTYTYTDLTSHDQVYFDRVRCTRKFAADLYVVQNAETALTAHAAAGSGVSGRNVPRVVGLDGGPS